MPLLLLSKSNPLRWDSIWVPLTETADSVSPRVPNQYNPTFFPIGDGFGLFVFFDRYETAYFRNGAKRKPTSKPRRSRGKKNGI